VITIKVEGVEDLLVGLAGMQRQIPYAMANGVNAVARKIKEAEIQEMRAKFKSPTPFTLNGLRIKPAKAPRSVEATVWFKYPPNLSQKDHYLLPQVEGGDRPLKPYEMGLGGRFTLPGKGLTLDRYGNLGRGQLTKILSQSGKFRESGFKMNRSRKGSKARDMFMVTKPRGKMLPGIYERVSTASQLSRAHQFALGAKNQTAALRKALTSRSPRGIRPVLIFPKQAPTYSKRFDFYGVAQRVFDANFRPELTKAIDAEIVREMAYRARKGMPVLNG